MSGSLLIIILFITELLFNYDLFHVNTEFLNVVGVAGVAGTYKLKFLLFGDFTSKFTGIKNKLAWALPAKPATPTTFRNSVLTWNRS